MIGKGNHLQMALFMVVICPDSIISIQIYSNIINMYSLYLRLDIISMIPLFNSIISIQIKVSDVRTVFSS